MSTNFEPALLPRLRAVVSFAAAGPSDFYRRKGLTTTPPASWEEFRARVPFLERRELLAAPWRERLFVPEEQVRDFGISSGTADAGRPLIVPRLGPYQDAMLRHTAPPELLSSLGVRRLMVLLPPMSGLARNLPKLPLPGVTVVPGDVRAVDASALAAAELGVDGWVTTPAGLERLVEACERLGVSLAGARWVSLGGEGLSRAKLAWLRARLPGARFSLRYGSAETGPRRFYRCDLLEEEPALFHAAAGSHLFEIVDPEGRLCAPGRTGELVHTDLDEPSAFPFLRYRTGDAAVLEERPCACGAPLLRLSGRLGFDSFRYAGVTLSVEMVERALAEVGGLAGPDFRLRLTEEPAGGRPVPRLSLRLLAPRTVPPGPAREELARALERAIPGRLRLSASATLEQLCRRGAFHPLRVELVDEFPPQGGGKPRRIVAEL